MIRIAICDDNKADLDKIEKSVRNGFSRFTDDYNVCCFTDGSSLLLYNNKQPFDVLFLDIDMPSLTGFDVAKHLRASFNQCFIIFVTSHSDLVYSSFDFQPFNFIQKVSGAKFEERIAYVIEKLMKHMKQNVKIVLENGTETLVTYYRSIVYIESDKHYLKYYIQNREEEMTIRGAINDAEKTMSSFDFVRIHRSYIANLKYIKTVSQNLGKVYVNFNGIRVTLPLGANYKDDVYNRHIQYMRDIT